MIEAVRRPKPPRLAVALLQWCTPPETLGAISGDLAEEFDEHARRDEARAARWYWRQVTASALPLLWLRVGRSPRANRVMADGIALFIGCGAISGGALLATATASFLVNSSLALGLGVGTSAGGVRLIDVVLPFALGGYAAGLKAPPSSNSAITALRILSGLAAMPVLFELPIVSSWGAAAIAYHLLLLASVIPAVSAGWLLGRKSLREVRRLRTC